MQKNVSSLPCSAVGLREVIQEESIWLMINMNRVLLLLLFYSSLPTGEMICTVLCVPFFPGLDGGPTAAGKMATEEPVVLPASITSPAKMESLGFVSLMDHFLKPLASLRSWHQTLVFPSASSCVVLAWNSSSSFPGFCLHLTYSLPWCPLYLNYPPANLPDWKFMT